MARLNVALAFVLATCFASTFAIYMECTMDNYDKCLEPEADVKDNTDPDDFCKPKMMVRSCLHNLEPSCSDGSNPNVQQKVADKLRSLNEELSDCPDDDPEVGVMMVATMNNHKETTRYPTSEPKTDNYHTTMEPFSDQCDSDSFQRCSTHMQKIATMSDMSSICYGLGKVRECFMAFVYNCKDENDKNNAWNYIKSVDSQMSSCHDDHKETTRYPTSEPKPENGVCSHEMYDKCTNPLNQLDSNAYLKPEEQCRIWWNAKVCYGHLYHRCSYDSPVKAKIEGTWVYMETAMSFCNALAGCTDDERKRCGEDMQRAYDREEKCRAAGKARSCLQDLKEDCKDQFVMNQIDYESMPMVENEINDCMYGHGDGWDNDGYYQGASTSSFSMAFPILTLISALVAKLMFY